MLQQELPPLNRIAAAMRAPSRCSCRVSTGFGPEENICYLSADLVAAGSGVCIEKQPLFAVACVAALMMSRHSSLSLTVCLCFADPIEMGALAAVLLAPSSSSPTRQQPLTLSAAKAMMGHSEPAAGVVGLLTLAAELTHSAAPGLLHLTTLNPYVSSVFNAARGSAAGSMSHATVSISRQTRGGPLGSRGLVHGGVSSFAFQGTNAHAVISTAPADAAGHRQSTGFASALMHRQRQWVLPKPHTLLTAAVADHGSVILQCHLSNPRLAFLLDHQVMGRALFPAAGMLEAAAAAAKTMLDDQAFHHLWACTVSDMIITAPLQLSKALSQHTASALLLHTCVHAATGTVQISSASAGTTQPLHHARCAVSMAVKGQHAALTLQPSGEHQGALAHLMVALHAAVAGDESIGRRRAGPGAGTGAEAGDRADGGAASVAAADAIGQVSHTPACIKTWELGNPMHVLAGL